MKTNVEQSTDEQDRTKDPTCSAASIKDVDRYRSQTLVKKTKIIYIRNTKKKNEILENKYNKYDILDVEDTTPQECMKEFEVFNDNLRF